MPPTNLPAHLQNRNIPNLTARATDGMGSQLPPRVSIQGNSFTLIDSVGHEQSMGSIMEACVIDMADHMAKRYYPPDKKWGPDSNDPPLCFSMNGIAPSREAQTPQSPTCASCEWNKRGSAVSQMSGAPIKACRDEKPIALLFPQFPTILFQLVITPGSFKNWGAYVKQFEQHQVNLADVLTQFSFQAKASGVLEFKPAPQIWIDPPTAEASERALAAKLTDVLVGRLDRPIQAALSASTANTAVAVNAVHAAPNPLHAPIPGPVGEVFHPPVQPAPQHLATPGFGVSPQPVAPAGNGSVTTAAPTEEPPKQRRRRTKAEMEADAHAEKTVQHNAPEATPAPFRMATPPAGAAPFGAPAASPPGQFGIQGGVEPNPELQATLKNVFGQ